MKYIIFIIGLAGVIPISGWIRSHPQHAPKIWMLIGLLPFILTANPYFTISLIAWPLWTGIVRGFQVSILDLLILAVYLALPPARARLPFRGAMMLYFLAVGLSVFSAHIPFAAIFYVWQILRVFFVYMVVARAGSELHVIPSLLKGLALGLCLEACLTIWERFGAGVIQTGGSFGHQNILGLISHFAVFPFFALLLAGERSAWAFLTPLSGIVVAILTASRATLGLAAFGFFALFVLSSLRQWTARKAKIATAGLAILIVATPLALSSLDLRFTTTGNIEAYDERAALINAASMMLSDHPMGVGANNFGIANNMLGYATRAEIAPTFGSLSAQVHNIYWLTLAETGYLGLVTLILLLASPLIAAFLCGWRSRGDRRGDLLLGLAVALLVVYLHSYFEWIFLFFQVEYVFAITIGMVAALTQQLGYWSSRADGTNAVLQER